MNKKFLISVVALFILSLALDGLIHGFLLKSAYVAQGSLYRADDDAQNYVVYMVLAHVLLAIGFVWIYLRGRQDRPFMAQGLRYGAAVALLATIPGYLVYYAVQPLPGMMVALQIIFSTIAVLIMGVAVAALNK